MNKSYRNTVEIASYANKLAELRKWSFLNVMENPVVEK